MLIFSYGVTALQGGKPPSFLKAAIAALPIGIIPSWEIKKEGGDANEYI